MSVGHTEESGPRVLSLCSGVGFLDRAVRLAFPGARTRLFVEIEAFAIEELVRQMEEELIHPAPIWTDLLTFDPRPWRHEFDLVVAGFPCQPASVAGKRGGFNDERWIWPYIARILEELDAPCIFLENVPGLLTVNGGEGYQEVLSDLASLGFHSEYDHFRASDVGAPHKRERWFLFGRRPVADARGARLDGHGQQDSGSVGSQLEAPLRYHDDGRDPSLERGSVADSLWDGQRGQERQAGPGRGVREDGDEVVGGRVALSDDSRRGTGQQDLQTREPDVEGSDNGNGRGRVAGVGHSGLEVRRGLTGDVCPEQPPAERDGDRLDGGDVQDLERRGNVGDTIGRDGERRGGSSDLARPSRASEIERYQREWRRRATRYPVEGGMPLFPPGPKSLRWCAIAYYRPDLFPALTPDGRIPESSPFYPFYVAGLHQSSSQLEVLPLAHERDRGAGADVPEYPRTELLRAAGNGVVTHCAALALMVLAGRLLDSESKEMIHV